MDGGCCFSVFLSCLRIYNFLFGRHVWVVNVPQISRSCSLFFVFCLYFDFNGASYRHWSLLVSFRATGTKEARVMSPSKLSLVLAQVRRKGVLSLAQPFNTGAKETIHGSTGTLNLSWGELEIRVKRKPEAPKYCKLSPQLWDDNSRCLDILATRWDHGI
jgi:hypothetical protein